MNFPHEGSQVKSKHRYLRRVYGEPTYCSNLLCKRRSSVFDWAKRTEREYTHSPDDYIWLCRSCHRIYDMTPGKQSDCLKNLRWSGGNARTKLKLEQVDEIRARLKNGESKYEIVKDYAVHWKTIEVIGRGKIWQPTDEKLRFDGASRGWG